MKSNDVIVIISVVDYHNTKKEAICSMNKEFRNGLGWKIIFTDKKIILRKDNLEKVYPYGSIKDIKFTFPSALTIIEHELAENGKNKSNFFTYNDKAQKAKLEEMVSFVKEQMKNAPQAQAERKVIEVKNNHIYRFDCLHFKVKAGTVQLKGGLFNSQKFHASAITSPIGMSFSKDLAFHKVKITFFVGDDKYIIEGDPFNGVSDIPIEEYYDDMVRNSGMTEEEKRKVLKNKSYGNVEMFANGVIKQSKEPIKSKEKEASVVGRAIVGAAIAGETGAIVGALSAVDKNNKNKK